MILMLFLYDPLYTSSHDLESDYPWCGLKDENSPTPHLNIILYHYKVLFVKTFVKSSSTL